MTFTWKDTKHIRYLIYSILQNLHFANSTLLPPKGEKRKIQLSHGSKVSEMEPFLSSRLFLPLPQACGRPVLGTPATGCKESWTGPGRSWAGVGEESELGSPIPEPQKRVWGLNTRLIPGSSSAQAFCASTLSTLHGGAKKGLL